MIEILMPVYNGEKYLAEQIDSILNQTYTDWVLKIRNDGSSDNSQIIIDKYCKAYPSKIICYSEVDYNIGLSKSLNFLMKTSQAAYIMFSDQDDVWLKDKIKLTLNEMLRMEELYGNCPAMVCTDAVCIDADRNVIAKSFFESQKFIHGVVGNKIKMLALNEVQGCTIMVNKYAMQYIAPFPDIVRVHDMWIGVVVAHYGHVFYLPRQTLLYRQHENNTVGIISVGWKYYFKRGRYFFSFFKSRLKLFRELPFYPNIFKWIWYKIEFALRRSI